MKLHLPARLFRAVMALMAALPVLAQAVEIPDSYTKLPVTTTTEVTDVSDEALDYALLLRNDLTFTGVTVMGDFADSRFFTSSSATDRSSLTFTGDCYLRVEDLETLTLAGLNELTFSENAASSYTASSYYNEDGALGGAIFARGLGAVTITDNKSVLFSENVAKNTSGSARGGAIYSYAGDIDLSGNGDVTFSGNYASSVSHYGCGGAIYSYSGSINLSGNGNVTFSGNYASSVSHYGYGGAIYSYSGSINLSGNGNVTFSGNYASTNSSGYGGAIYSSSGSINLSGNGNVTFSGNYASSSGGAIYSSDAPVTLSGNKEVIFIGNHAGYGGAICVWSDDDLTISENGTVQFTGNYAARSSSGGGAIYVYNGDDVNIRDNGSVVFENNYARTGSGTASSPYVYRMRSLYNSGGTVRLSAASGNSIEFRDSLYARSLHLNERYQNSAGQTVDQTGDIIITGKYTAAHLGALKSDYTVTELENSLTSGVAYTTTLYDGRLIVRDDAILYGKGLVVKSSVSGKSTPTVLLENASLYQRESAISFASGTRFEVSGQSVAISDTLTMASGSELTLHATGANAHTEVLQYIGSFTMGENLTLNISFYDEQAGAGMYKLMTVSSLADAENWTADKITVQGLGGLDISLDSLVWQDNTLYLSYDGEGGTLVLEELTWTDDSGSHEWDTSDKNWTQDSHPFSYQDGVKVLFGDTAAGTVTLVGELAPEAVVVDSREGKDYTFVADAMEGGKLTGTMSLTKKGGSTLTINTANDYTGGTSVEEGKLVAGTATALGSGSVALKGGTLDLNGQQLANGITATGGTLTGADSFAGKLTVDGQLSLSGTVTAGEGLELTSGSLSGGSIAATDVLVNSTGSVVLSSAITGESSLTVKGGEVTLSGNNDYTGGTVITNGSAIAGTTAALGSGAVTVDRGVLDLNGLRMTNDITLKSGNLTGGQNHRGRLIISGNDVTVTGGYTLSSGKVLEVAAGGATLNSSLTLGGGMLVLNGSPLTVDGAVTFTSGSITLLDLSQCRDVLYDGYTLALLGTDVTGWQADSMKVIGMGGVSLNFDPASGVISLQIAGPAGMETITWLGAKKTVWQEGKAGWINATTGIDAVFESGADVIFTQAGTVTICGAVEPGSIIVAGDKSITFKSDKNNPGSITGETSLTKRGAGKFTLNDGNTYSGGTIIEGGTLVAGGANAFGSGDITLSAGTLDLKSKAVENDILLKGAGTIKSGKKFLGSLTLAGNLQKGSDINIVDGETATLTDGAVHGTISGAGAVEVTGEVELGTTGKLTTNSLHVTGDLSLSTKGLSMNTKTSSISVTDGGHIQSAGALKAYSMELDGGTVDFVTAKPTSVTITDTLSMSNGAAMSLTGKMTVGNLSMSNASLQLGSPAGMNKPQNLTVKKNLTLGSGSSLTLNGKLTASNLTLEGGTLNLTSSKVQTIAVKNTLTLGAIGAFDLNFDFDVEEGKSFKLFTFKTLVGGTGDLYGQLGLSDEFCILSLNAKDITLTVTDLDEMRKHMDANEEDSSFALADKADKVVLSENTVDPVMSALADTLVQSTWGVAGASRAFADTVAGRGAHATLLEGGKGAAWVSVMGGSSRISSDGGHKGADFTLSGAAIGIEGNVTEKSTIGLAIGNSWGKVSPFSAYRVDQDSTHYGLYGNHALRNNLTLSWMAAHTRTESDGNLAGMDCDWTQDALQLDARLTWSRALNEKTTVSAFGGLQYLATDSADFNGLSTGSVQNLRTEIGAGITHKVAPATQVYGELSFIGDVARNNPTATVGDYRTRGANPGRVGMNLHIGAAHQLNDSWSVNAGYSFELQKNATSHSLNAGASYKF